MPNGRTDEEKLYGQKVVFRGWTRERPRDWQFVKLLEPKEVNGARLMATGRVIDVIRYSDGSTFYGVEWNFPVKPPLPATWMLREEIERTDGVVKAQAPVPVASGKVVSIKAKEGHHHAERQARRTKVRA